MALWGKTDAAASAPKNKNVISTKGSRGNTAFDNTTPSALVTNLAVGVFGVSTAEAQATTKVAHPGWVLRKAYTGPVDKIAITAQGTGYTNGDFVKVSGGHVNAVAAVGTDAAGKATSLTFTNHGEGFVNTSTLTVAVVNSTFGATTGSGATFTVTLGGRAGRVHNETLVAGGLITGDADSSTF